MYLQVLASCFSSVGPHKKKSSRTKVLFQIKFSMMGPKLFYSSVILFFFSMVLLLLFIIYKARRSLPFGFGAQALHLFGLKALQDLGRNPNYKAWRLPVVRAFLFDPCLDSIQIPPFPSDPPRALAFILFKHPNRQLKPRPSSVLHGISTRVCRYPFSTGPIPCPPVRV